MQPPVEGLPTNAQRHAGAQAHGRKLQERRAMTILQNTDLRILVVDDQDSVRQHLCQELLRMGPSR